MIFVSLHLDGHSKYRSQILDDGTVLVIPEPDSLAHHTTLTFEDAAAFEAFYDFLGTVMAGIRFDALEEAGKAEARVAPVSV